MSQLRAQESGHVELNEEVSFLRVETALLYSRHAASIRRPLITKLVPSTMCPVLQMPRIYAPRQVVGWIFLSRTMSPLCRRCICLNFSNSVTNERFPFAWITTNPTQGYRRVSPQRLIPDFHPCLTAEVLQ